jgi:DNA primase
MRILRVDNYIIETPLYEIVNQLRLALTNGKLREIKAWHEGDDNIVVTCPNRHHKGGREHSAAMNIYVGDNSKIQYGYCKCWACDFQCSFVRFVAECFECSEDFAKNWLIERYGILAEVAVITDDDIVIKPRKSSVKLPANFLDNLQSWHPYLAERKLSREVCELFKVKYDPQTSQIVFPCFDVAGNLLMAPRRSIVYKNFYLDKSQDKPVYCLDYIIKNNITTAMICEGPIDVLTCYTYGYPAIGTFGNPSPSQINAINKSPIKILYLAMDNDSAGRRMANTIKAGLDPRIIIKEVSWGFGKKDCNELTYDEFKKVMEQAKNS